MKQYIFLHSHKSEKDIIRNTEVQKTKDISAFTPDFSNQNQEFKLINFSISASW